MSETTQPETKYNQDKAAFYADLAAAQKAVEAVEKTSVNSFHKYKYASAEAVIAEARVALSANGLAFFTVSSKPRTRTDAAGTIESYLDVKYVLTHRSGHFEEFEQEVPIIIERGKPADKAVFAAMTEGLAYQLRGLLLIERVPEDTPTPSARDDRNFTPPARRPEPPKAKEPEAFNSAPANETDDQRAARLLKAIQSALSEAEIKAAAQAAQGLPKSYTSTLKAAADKRREELAAQ